MSTVANPRYSVFADPSDPVFFFSGSRPNKNINDPNTVPAMYQGSKGIVCQINKFLHSFFGGL